jgi:hypothetical protein
MELDQLLQQIAGLTRHEAFEAARHFVMLRADASETTRELKQREREILLHPMRNLPEIEQLCRLLLALAALEEFDRPLVKTSLCSIGRKQPVLTAEALSSYVPGLMAMLESIGTKCQATPSVKFDEKNGELMIHLTPTASFQVDRELADGLRLLPVPIADKVSFSAYCPRRVTVNSSFCLLVLAYQPNQQEEAETRARSIGGFPKRRVGEKSPLVIDRNTFVTITVSLPGFEVEDTTDSFQWTGDVANAEFIVRTPESMQPGEYKGTARIFLGGTLAARFVLHLQVGPEADDSASRWASQRIRTAFASYASSDRLEVLHWKRHVQSVGVDAFVDVVSLRPGDDWSERLWTEIEQRDLFCLFWSKAASESHWVTEEWKAALKSKGCEYIQPIPLVDVRQVPPPDPLSKCLHFEDTLRVLINAESLWRSQPKPISE